MASPSFAEMVTQLKDIVRSVNNLWVYANTQATSFIANQDTLTQNLEGDHAGDRLNALEDIRDTLAIALNDHKRAFDAWILDVAKVIATEKTSISGILQDLFTYMDTNTQRVLTRDITRGAIAAGGGNQGDGTVYFLDVDWLDYAIEDFPAAYKSASIVSTAECILDAASGVARGAETFRVSIKSQPSLNDALDPAWARILETRSRLVNDSTNLLQNPDFRTFNSANNDQFTGWWESTNAYTGVTQDTTTAFSYRPLSGTETTSNQGGTYSTAVLASGHLPLYQYIKNLNPNWPYFCAVRWRDDAGAADGNMKVTLGSVSKTQAVNGTGAFQLLILNSSTAKNAWPYIFNQDDLKLQIERDSESAGIVYVSGVYLIPYDYFNGRFFIITPGTANYRAEPGDTFTWTDTTGATAGAVQYHVNLWYASGGGGFYFPHTIAGTPPEITDP